MRLPPVVAKRIAACLTLVLSVALLPPVAWAHVSIGHDVQATLHAGWALRRLDRDRDVRRPPRGAAGPGSGRPRAPTMVAVSGTMPGAWPNVSTSRPHPVYDAQRPLTGARRAAVS
jgi:hypothetical protein